MFENPAAGWVESYKEKIYNFECAREVYTRENVRASERERIYYRSLDEKDQDKSLRQATK